MQTIPKQKRKYKDIHLKMTNGLSKLQNRRNSREFNDETMLSRKNDEMHYPFVEDYDYMIWKWKNKISGAAKWLLRKGNAKLKTSHV